jgi:hypothetical protein
MKPRYHENHIESPEIARMFDVPPWLVDPAARRPRFARLRWALRRWWPL